MTRLNHYLVEALVNAGLSLPHLQPCPLPQHGIQGVSLPYAKQTVGCCRMDICACNTFLHTSDKQIHPCTGVAAVGVHVFPSWVCEDGVLTSDTTSQMSELQNLLELGMVPVIHGKLACGCEGGDLGEQVCHVSPSAWNLDLKRHLRVHPCTCHTHTTPRQVTLCSTARGGVPSCLAMPSCNASRRTSVLAQ